MNQVMFVLSSCEEKIVLPTLHIFHGPNYICHEFPVSLLHNVTDYKCYRITNILQCKKTWQLKVLLSIETNISCFKIKLENAKCIWVWRENYISQFLPYIELIYNFTEVFFKLRLHNDCETGNDYPFS